MRTEMGVSDRSRGELKLTGPFRCSCSMQGPLYNSAVRPRVSTLDWHTNLPTSAFLVSCSCYCFGFSRDVSVCFPDDFRISAEEAQNFPHLNVKINSYEKLHVSTIIAFSVGGHKKCIFSKS